MSPYCIYPFAELVWIKQQTRKHADTRTRKHANTNLATKTKGLCCMSYFQLKRNGKYAHEFAFREFHVSAINSLIFRFCLANCALHSICDLPQLIAQILILLLQHRDALTQLLVF